MRNLILNKINHAFAKHGNLWITIKGEDIGEAKPLTGTIPNDTRKRKKVDRQRYRFKSTFCY